MLSRGILANYVKKRALLSIVAALVGLWGLQLVFSYLAELEDISDQYTLLTALYYIVLRAPEYLYELIPTATLLGCVIGLGMLASHSELTVMRAAGVSITRLVIWVLQPALLFVLLSLVLNQAVLPLSMDAAKAIKNPTANLSLEINGYWAKDKQRIFYIDYANAQGELGHITLWQTEGNNITQVLSAPSGQYLSTTTPVPATTSTVPTSTWQLKDVTELTIGSEGNATQAFFPRRLISLPVQPETLYLLVRPAESLSLTQLWHYRQVLASQGSTSLPHELALWQKLFSPLAIVSLVLIACSFVFGSLRQRSLGSRIVIALLIGLSFRYIQDLAGFMSLSLQSSPALFVLLPIITSGIIGVYLLRRQG